MRLKALYFLLVMLLPMVARADVYSDALATFKQSPVAQKFFDSAYAYAVFPSIVKGGLGVGAAHGNGRVYRGEQVVGSTSMTQLSVGLQMGGQAYSQIIFLQDKRAFDDFTSGNFEFGAGASAIAITAAAQASASTTGVSASTGSHAERTRQAEASYTKGMAVMTVAKGGLMYEAAIAGQKYGYTPR
ncbi:lipid-binding SYLF domain-containing protein [Simiduia sp. 21SJ11W-1]|uniref:lipid-binding SYLF domain-containing protein n=1 Tax=Simiduia sp. 21SJ11W-1 TaxID=2909669 RepID=UPI0020A16B2F|nr:lipid-binding SYLF domain-containing protein [Simiduia sp. 21SJ11W-1]UTA47181.1 lipid-binding SYLF domain-containing protein [Simiduia sp. 21SJ11W-1]